MAEYEKLTVAKLREVFKERGIPATGLTKKQQLIDKLHEVDAEAGDTGKTAEELNGAEPSANGQPTESAVPELDARPTASSAEAQEPADEQAEAVVEEKAELAAPAEQPFVEESAPKPEPAPVLSETKSPSPKALEDDGNKRKRRSPTPPMDEEAVAHKRQKQEEEAAEAPIAPLIAWRQTRLASSCLLGSVLFQQSLSQKLPSWQSCSMMLHSTPFTQQ